MKELEKIKYFIESSPDFWKDLSIKKLDLKHKNVLKNFKDKFTAELFKENLRKWSMQDDGPIPFQLSLYNIKEMGIINFLIFYFRFILSKFKKYDLHTSFYDDIDHLKKIGAYKLLARNPVHKTPYVKGVYFIEKKISSNYRWSKYIYYTWQIEKKKLLKNGSTWIDIGPFYGGLQGIVAKDYKNLKIILVDFHHQLCRSYIYLSKIFPESKHIMPAEINDINKLEIIGSNYFIYVPIQNITQLNKLKPTLVTNFFSFGEMTKHTFESYLNSQFIKKAEFVYTVNRFISSPCFEMTYNNDLSILDYKIKNFKNIYFDAFPINHYQTPYRKIHNRYAPRPTSSSYFELIMKRTTK